MTAIKNVTIVLHNHYIYDGVVLIEDNKIFDFGKQGKIEIPNNAQIIDGEGLYIGPGLVDIHTHSGGGIWFFDDPVNATYAHLKNGTTSILPALYFNLTRENMIDAVEKFRQAQSSDIGKVIKGAYMEGPYLNPKFGCDVAGNKWSQGVFKEDYLPLVEGVKDFAKVWCIAPEIKGVGNFVEDVKSIMPNAIFSVAHSEATPYEVEHFMDYGLKLSSHHTNATGTLEKYPECRGVCVDEAVNYNDDIYAELICDSVGIHVDPYMLRLVLKIKGKSRIILISDAFVCDGPKPDGYDGVDDINFDWEGEIAGFKGTLSIACRNMIQHTGASICDIFNFASYNPAKAVNLKGYGEIKKGNFADLILVDDKMNVKKVILGGKVVE